MTTTFLADLNIDQIHHHDLNPRKDVGDIGDLTASIKAHGVLEPLVVAPNGNGYQLITGHRRLAAAGKAGLDAVPVVVRADLDTEPRQLEAMLIENTQRVDLTPVEEAQAYAQLVAFPGYTPGKAAKATGRSLKTVKSRLAIAGLPEVALERIHNGQITLHDAEVIAEFTGTSQFDHVLNAAGLTNFEWTVQRAREVLAGEAALVTIREYCTGRKWGTVTSRPLDAETVIAGWRMPDDLPAALAALKGKHVLWVSANGDWALMKQWPTRDTSTTSTSSSSPRAKTPEEVARDKRQEDVNTARTVRLQYFTGRLDKLVLKDTERVDILRLLVANELEMAGAGHGELTFAGIDVEDDDDLDASTKAWIAAASEQQLWKALIVLVFQLESCGSTHGTWDHERSIRVAVALGYTPSDIERELIAPKESEQ